MTQQIPQQRISASYKASSTCLYSPDFIFLFGSQISLDPTEILQARLSFGVLYPFSSNGSEPIASVQGYF